MRRRFSDADAIGAASPADAPCALMLVLAIGAASPADALCALMLVLAIGAEKCSSGRD
ncbi:MAG: hypothetical protein ACI4O7_01290 [Aristaeellaceae bacterium]